MDEVYPAWFYNLQEHRKTCKPVTLGRSTFVPVPTLLRLSRYFDQMWEATAMARAVKNKRATQFAEIDFISRRLTEAEGEAFVAWQNKEAKKIGDEIAAFIGSGNKVSVTWDDYNTCFIVSATCKDEVSDNHNKCLSARSDDWYEALLMVLFKAQVIFNGGTWESEQKAAAWG